MTAHAAYAAQARSAYRTNEVTTLTQRDLIVRLYQGAERFSAQAQAAMAERRLEDAHNCCVKTRRIFLELMATLNHEQGGEIAGRLRALYEFFALRISEANLRKDPQPLVEIAPIIASLREAWEQVPAEFANTSAGPIQENAVNIST